MKAAQRWRSLSSPASTIGSATSGGRSSTGRRRQSSRKSPIATHGVVPARMRSNVSAAVWEWYLRGVPVAPVAVSLIGSLIVVIRLEQRLDQVLRAWREQALRHVAPHKVECILGACQAQMLFERFQVGDVFRPSGDGLHSEGVFGADGVDAQA